MRVLDAFDEPIRAVTVSPDGRFLAAGIADELIVFDWISGECLSEVFIIPGLGQFTFTATGGILIFRTDRGLAWFSSPMREDEARIGATGSFSGGVAVSPDGKTLIATRAGQQQQVKLDQWELLGWRPKGEIDYWSPFDRLAFSPNGEHIAGISRESFELRFANSFGLNRREMSTEGLYLPRAYRRPTQRPAPPRSAFLTFPRHSETVVFGWDAELRVMETRAGNMLRRVPTPGQPFADAAFVGSGRHLATVDGTSVMRLWSAEVWEVVREYDWGAGGLTCVTATADGLAGVCGTDAGQLVVFDVDE